MEENNKGEGMLNKIKNGVSGLVFLWSFFVNRYLKYVGFIYGLLMGSNVKRI